MGKNRKGKRGLPADIVIGMSDGLIIPFALAAGLCGAHISSGAMIITCLAAIIAGALAMGFGAYTSWKKEFQAFREKEEPGDVESGAATKDEWKKERTFYSNIGLPREMQERAIAEMVEENKKWSAFINKYGLVPEKKDPLGAFKAGRNIGISYAAGGLMPLLPFFFLSHRSIALLWSAAITMVFLFVLGFLKGLSTPVNPWLSAFRLTIMGALAGWAANQVAGLIAG